MGSSVYANDTLSKGSAIYKHYCAICHGEKGDGQGPVASLFQTKPRNLIKGEYKLKSTPSGVPPLDEDLIRSVKFGLPGTAMTAQSHLSDEEINEVVTYIKTFSPRFSQTKTRKPIPLPPTLISSPERVRNGRSVYQKSQCIQCHGQEGKGDGVLAKELSIKPMDLTRRPFKGGSAPENIVRIILTGIEGTPMPPYQFIIEDQNLWDLAYYIDSLGENRSKLKMKKKDGR